MVTVPINLHFDEGRDRELAEERKGDMREGSLVSGSYVLCMSMSMVVVAMGRETMQDGFFQVDAFKHLHLEENICWGEPARSGVPEYFRYVP